MEKVKLIIFDLDGTLVDAYKAIRQSFNFTMRKLGVPPRLDKTINQAVGWGDEKLLLPFVGKALIKKALKIYRSHHCLSLVKETRILPGAFDILRYLKTNGYRLAIASNRPYRFTQIILRSLGLKKFFDFVLCADQINRIKPDAQILKKILHRFNVKADEAVYVGDMHIDAQTGNNAKVKTIIVSTGNSSTLKQIKKERPFKIVSRLSILKKIF